MKTSVAALVLITIASASNVQAAAPIAADTEPSAGLDQVRKIAVTGRMLDADGKPLPSANVSVVNLSGPSNGGAIRAQAVTGTDGSFTLHVPGGLSRSDSVSVFGQDAKNTALRTSVPIVLENDAAAISLGDIMMVRPYDFQVQVRGNGKPVAGAVVDFGNSQMRTDEAGMVSYHQGPAQYEISMTFTLRADGFVTDEWRATIGSGQTTHVIDLTPESLQAGRILDTSGRPISQAMVSAVPLHDPQAIGMTASGNISPDRTAGTARSDATGAFTLHGLRAGQQYRLSISTDKLSFANTQRTITAGPPFDIRLPPASVPLTVRVSGAAMASYTGSLGIAPQLTPSRVGSFWVDFRFLRGPTLMLEWLDPATGSWSTVFSARHVKVIDAEHAEVAFDQVPAGTLRVFVSSSINEVAPDLSDPVTVAAGTRAVIPVQLLPSRQLRLRVIDKEGNAVPNVLVAAERLSGRISNSVRTDAEGWVTLPVHPNRDVNITVRVADVLVANETIYGGATQPAPIVVSVRQ